MAVSFFAKPRCNYIITIISEDEIENLFISPLRYKAQISKIKSNLTTNINQKFLIECDGRIDTLVPTSKFNNMFNKNNFEVAIYNGNKKVRSIDFENFIINRCDLKITNSILQVISDSSEIFISIDDKFINLPKNKKISLNGLNDEKFHVIKHFQNIKL